MLDLIARTTAAPHNQIPEPFRDMFLPKWHESHAAVRRGGLLLVNLSRGWQPVAV